MNFFINRKCAGVYKNERFYSIITYSGQGLWRSDFRAKEHVLLADASDQALGHAIWDALSQSRIVQPKDDPELWDNDLAKQRVQVWNKQRMQRFGYKTRGAMFRHMKICNISLRDGMIQIRPSKRERGGNLYTGESFEESDYVYIPETSTEAEIGAGLRLALSRCIPRDIE